MAESQSTVGMEYDPSGVPTQFPGVQNETPEVGNAFALLSGSRDKTALTLEEGNVDRFDPVEGGVEMEGEGVASGMEGAVDDLDTGVSNESRVADRLDDEEEV